MAKSNNANNKAQNRPTGSLTNDMNTFGSTATTPASNATTDARKQKNPQSKKTGGTTDCR